MNSIPLLRSYISRIENILRELNHPYFNGIDLPNILTNLDELKTKFAKLSRLTNKGKSTKEVKIKKLKSLRTWLEAYSADKAKTINDHLPKKLKNKNVVTDTSLTDKYQQYAELAIEYIEEIEPSYQGIQKEVIPLLSLREKLLKDYSLFELSDKHFPSVDELAADDGEDLTDALIEAKPAAMIKSIGATLKFYARYIKEIQTIQEEIEDLLGRLGNLDLKTLYAGLNKKNKLTQSLFKNLVNANKILYQDEIRTGPNGLLFREKYKQLVRECLQYLPNEVREAFEADGRFGEEDSVEQELARSPGGVERYDPLTDPAMQGDFPHLPKPKRKPTEPAQKPKMQVNMDDVGNEEVDVRFSEPELDPDFSEEEKQFFDSSPESGEKLNDDEKKKYEKLWEVAASYSLDGMTKLAKEFETKYKLPSL